MNWNAMKMAALNALLKWVAGQLWDLAKETVDLMNRRDDLSGAEKFMQAKNILHEHLVLAGRSLQLSAINFLLEAAVQFYKAKTGKAS